MPSDNISCNDREQNVKRWVSRASIVTPCSPPVSRFHRFVTLVDQDRASKRKRRSSEIGGGSLESASKRVCQRRRISSWSVHYGSSPADPNDGVTGGLALQVNPVASKFADDQKVPDQQNGGGLHYGDGEGVGTCMTAPVCSGAVQRLTHNASWNRIGVFKVSSAAEKEGVVERCRLGQDASNSPGVHRMQPSVSNCRSSKEQAVVPCEPNTKAVCADGACLPTEGVTDSGKKYGCVADVSCGDRSIEVGEFSHRDWLLTLDAVQHSLPVRSELPSWAHARNASGSTPSYIGVLEDPCWNGKRDAVVTGRKAKRASADTAGVEGPVGANRCEGSRKGDMEGSWLNLGSSWSRGAQAQHGTSECAKGGGASTMSSGDKHGGEGGEARKGGSRRRHSKLKKLSHLQTSAWIMIGSSSPDDSEESDSPSSNFTPCSVRERGGTVPCRKSVSEISGGSLMGQKTMAGEAGACGPRPHGYYPRNRSPQNEDLASKSLNHHACNKTPSRGKSIQHGRSPLQPYSSERALLVRTVPNGGPMHGKAKPGKMRSSLVLSTSSERSSAPGTSSTAVPSSSPGFVTPGCPVHPAKGRAGKGGHTKNLSPKSSDFHRRSTTLAISPQCSLSSSSNDTYLYPSRSSSPSEVEADPINAISCPDSVPSVVSWLSSVSESSEESEDEDTISSSSDDEEFQSPAAVVSDSSASSVSDLSSFKTSSDSETSSLSTSSLWGEFRRRRRDDALRGKSVNSLQLPPHPIRMLLGNDDSNQPLPDAQSLPSEARLAHNHPLLLDDRPWQSPPSLSRSDVGLRIDKVPGGEETTRKVDDMTSLEVVASPSHSVGTKSAAGISGAFENLSLNIPRNSWPFSMQGLTQADNAAAPHAIWLTEKGGSFQKAAALPQSARWEIPSSLRQLTVAEMTRLKAVWSRGNDRESVSKFMGVEITRKDLATLQGESWLNDEVVNFYLSIIQSRNRERVQAVAVGSKAEDRIFPRVHIYSSFFFTRLACSPKGYDYMGVRRWTRTINIFDFDILIVPVNKQESHWTLLAVNVKDKVLEYYDSFLRSRSDFCYRVFDAMSRYLEDERLDKKHANTDADPSRPWRKRLMTDGIPQQEDAGSCGVFMCTFADLLASGYRPPFNFSQVHIPMIRLGIAADILFPGKPAGANGSTQGERVVNQNESPKVPAGAVICLLDDDD